MRVTLRHVVTAALVFVGLAFGTGGISSCSEATGGGTGGGGSRGGGSGGGGGAFEPFQIYTLDADAREATYFAVAFDSAEKRVGVVYVTPSATNSMSGVQDYDIKYVEWKQGVITVPPEKIRFVQRVIGVSVAFDPTNKEPVVALLGGASGFQPGMSIFWFQSDAEIQRRTASGWVAQIIAVDSRPPSCSPIDQGFLVGLFSTVIFDSTGKMYVAFRDGHNGQFPKQDWGPSDVEVWDNRSNARQCASSDEKEAYGGRIQMAIGEGDRPIMIFDRATGGADTLGQDIIFTKLQADGGWANPRPVFATADTMTGGTVGYHPTEGIGIAVTDRSDSILRYTKSTDNGANWIVAQEVFGSGTGGWYPSLAMDPVNNGEPAIAFYVCSARTGVNERNCRQDEDELRVIQRIENMWRDVTVDKEGGYAPKLTFFKEGDGPSAVSKRVIVYRTPAAIGEDDAGVPSPSKTAGTLKLAVEK